MNIQNNYGVNFGANRVMLAKNMVSKKKNDIVEVFKLGKDDIDFVKEKYQEIPEGLTLKNAHGRLKSFFKDFLGEKGSFPWKILGTNDYYIAIQNSKKLVGALKVKPSSDRVILKDVIQTNKQDALANKSLFMSLLSESEDKKGAILGVPHLMSSFKHNKNFINRAEIEDVEKNIKTLSPNIEFQKLNDEGVNLQYYLG